MLNQPTEIFAGWIAAALLAGGGLAAAGGLATLARVRRMRYFQLRRDALRHGWLLLVLSGALFLAAGVTRSLGPRALAALRSPTAQAAPPPAPSVPSPTATVAASPATRPSTRPAPGVRVTETPTPGPSGTPFLPEDLITPPGTSTVTPPPNAVAGNLLFTRRSDCSVLTGASLVFDAAPKTLYARFDYDNWLRGVQWSGVWARDGEVVYVETALWDGSTGGCGFTNYDHAGQPWTPGEYEVRIFIGETWLTSARFTVLAPPPAPTDTPTRTPRPTLTPTSTRTPRPTATLPATPTPRASPTLTATP